MLLIAYTYIYVIFIFLQVLVLLIFIIIHHNVTALTTHILAVSLCIFFSTRKMLSRARTRLGKVTPRVTDLPNHILRPDYAMTGRPSDPPMTRYTVHDEDGVSRMREAGRLTAEALDFAAKQIEVGISKDEVDRRIHDFIIANGAYPAPLNYRAFPKSSCISCNDVICHGIPDMNELKEGDLVSIDISLYTKDGYFGDSCRTWAVGENVEQEDLDLMRRSEEITLAAVEMCGPGVAFTQVGDIISSKCESYGYDSVRKYCGHSIGQSLHMPPLVHHYRGGNSFFDPVMKPGMTFTVEPMITAGCEANRLLEDGWTVVTLDGSWSSQFEHIVLITEDGHEILTESLE